jgi:hypothetical protein
MVDSIRRTNRIGVITPAGQMRTVERRRQSSKDHHHQNEDEASKDREESVSARPEDPSSIAQGKAGKPSQEDEDGPSTGRRIDVRI